MAILIQLKTLKRSQNQNETEIKIKFEIETETETESETESAFKLRALCNAPHRTASNDNSDNVGSIYGQDINRPQLLVCDCIRNVSKRPKRPAEKATGQKKRQTIEVACARCMKQCLKEAVLYFYTLTEGIFIVSRSLQRTWDISWHLRPNNVYMFWISITREVDLAKLYLSVRLSIRSSVRSSVRPSVCCNVS